MVLDPLTHAVRPDLADVRLAEYVFAPHYAEAVSRTLSQAAVLRRERGGEPLEDLAAGERFEVLDLVGEDAWGIAPDRRLVGYIVRQAVEQAA